jgi:trans-aconitate methyltransferase
VLDLGCGPGDICRRFARAFPDCRIHAVDASAPMLELGRRANREAQLDDRISCFQGYLPGARLPQPDYEIILSSSLLHHLAEPGTLWDSLRQLGRPGTRVFVWSNGTPAMNQTYSGRTFATPCAPPTPRMKSALNYGLTACTDWTWK